MNKSELQVGDIITLPGKDNRTVRSIDYVTERYTYYETSSPFFYTDLLDYLTGWQVKEEDSRMATEDELKQLEIKASDKQIAGNHYSKLKIQPMRYCLENNLNYGQSNTIKYITRYKDKNGVEDLKKAIHCIELLIEFEENKLDS